MPLLDFKRTSCFFVKNTLLCIISAKVYLFGPGSRQENEIIKKKNSRNKFEKSNFLQTFCS